MLLAIDIGNTNTKLGIFKNDELLFITRLNTSSQKTADQIAIEMRDFFRVYNILPENIVGAIISSVVPNRSSIIKNAVKSLCKITPLMLGPGLKSGINIKIDNPASLGADLVACAVAANRQYETPCIIYDLGTATTVTVIDKDKNLIGGAIMPGINISLDALINNAAKLSSFELCENPPLIGKNTTDCISSGLILGTSAMIDEFSSKIEDELGEKVTIVATGGLASLIKNHLKKEVIYNENLLLEGLRIIFEKNVKS